MAYKRTTGRRCRFESLETRQLAAGIVTADVTGGTLTIKSAGGATLFSGSFTGGTVMTTSGTTWVNASLGSAGGSGQISFGVGRLGTVSGDTVVTPEPGTLGLLGTGLVGLAGLVRRKLRA